MEKIFIMRNMKADKFHPGRLVMTRGVSDAIGLSDDFSEFVLSSIRRHICANWGDVSVEDAQLNQNALQSGGRLFSAYRKAEIVIWVITEEDRSLTTILFPNEY